MKKPIRRAYTAALNFTKTSNGHATPFRDMMLHPIPDSLYVLFSTNHWGKNRDTFAGLEGDAIQKYVYICINIPLRFSRKSEDQSHRRKSEDQRHRHKSEDESHRRKSPLSEDQSHCRKPLHI